MPSRREIIGPLLEVHSLFIDDLQQSCYTQRANGAANILSAGLDTANPSISTRTIVFSVDQAALTPPGNGVLDNSVDYRDRHVTYEIHVDPMRDIRFGKADDDRQALYQLNGTLYTRSGVQTFPIMQKLGGLTNPAVFLYVDGIGTLYIGKENNLFIRGTLKFSAQVKERT